MAAPTAFQHPAASEDHSIAKPQKAEDVGAAGSSANPSSKDGSEVKSNSIEALHSASVQHSGSPVQLLSPLPSLSSDLMLKSPTIATNATHISGPTRSSLKRKRNSMDLDSPTSPTRRTVTFSDPVEENEVESVAQNIRKEVQYALESRLEGDSEAFNVLRGYFGDQKDPGPAAPLTLERLRLYLVALTAQVGMLRRSCAPLVHSVLESEWLGQDDEYVSAYTRFLGGLVSSQGFWLAEVLRMIVDKFDGRTSSTVPLAPTTSVLQNRIHAALQYILRLVPSGSKVLGDSSGGRASLIAARFPHPSDTRRAHVRYVQNLLRVTEYAPELQGEVLTLVTERAVKIDVQVQVDFESLTEDTGDEIVSSLPTRVDDAFENEASDSESDMEDEDLVSSDATRLKSITRSMGTLDLILDQLFTYYSTAFANPSSHAAVSASRILLSHFRSLILPTYRSRHTQFLLFHFMQSTPSLVDDFLGTLVSLVLDRTRPRVLRQSGATYLASFVARGLHVSASMTRDVFSFIADQLSALRAQHEPTCLGPHPTKYGTYYALVQALLYMFCFRWRDLAISDDSSETLSPPPAPGVSSAAPSWAAAAGGGEGDLDAITFPADVKDALANNVFSPLNPLRLVAPAIAAEFVDTARKLRVLYAHHVLATNTRVKVLGHASGASGLGPTLLPGTPLSSSGTTTPRQGVASGTTTPFEETASAHSLKREDTRICLDGYFPFDPYQLPASKHWVDPDFREWQGLGDDDEDEDSSDEDDDDEEDEDGPGDEHANSDADMA